MPRPQKKKKKWNRPITINPHWRNPPLTKELEIARSAWRKDRELRKKREMMGADKAPEVTRMKRASKDRPKNDAGGKPLVDKAEKKKKK